MAFTSKIPNSSYKTGTIGSAIDLGGLVGNLFLEHLCEQSGSDDAAFLGESSDLFEQVTLHAYGNPLKSPADFGPASFSFRRAPLFSFSRRQGTGPADHQRLVKLPSGFIQLFGRHFPIGFFFHRF